MEPATGNVLKMLVGAVDKRFDKDSENWSDVPTISSSPPLLPPGRGATSPDALIYQNTFADAFQPRE